MFVNYINDSVKKREGGGESGFIALVNYINDSVRNTPVLISLVNYNNVISKKK